MAQFTIPGGNSKGVVLEAAEGRDIKFWLQKKAQRLNDEPDGRYAQQDQAWIEAAEAELLRREQGGAVQSAPSATTASRPASSSAPSNAQLEQVSGDTIAGSFVDPKKATAALQTAASHYHLVTPATSVGNLPEGCEIQVSLVCVAPNDPQLYRVGDKFGLEKNHLLSILGAAGGNMDYSHRLDDGRHPHYRKYQVGISYRLFDGTIVRRCGTAEIDVREPDGARYVEIVQKAREAKPPRDPSRQLLELRKFIDGHTESRALLRAIANMGIRRSYTKAELEKPFAVARLFFTGRSNDPATRTQFNAAIANSFLGGSSALYGAPPPPQHHSPAPAFHGHAPPTLSGRHVDTHGEDQGSDPHASDDMY